MQISIILPTYRRPHQLKEALSSIALQDLSLIQEIIIGDDSPEAERKKNRDVIAESGLGRLIRHIENDPPKGNYPNQISLGEIASSEYLMLLHDDDQLCENALKQLAAACRSESDPNVKIWFGRNLIMDECGRIDLERSCADMKTYGKDGQSSVLPLWDWCLRHSIPPNGWLMKTRTYQQFMHGPRDGNVGDWGMAVRMANSGASGSFIAEDISKYRVQATSETGKGIDAQYLYEIALDLKVPAERVQEKNELLRQLGEVATSRYVRMGERRLAWKCYLSADWHWKRRFSPKGMAMLILLMTPSILWRWKLRL